MVSGLSSVGQSVSNKQAEILAKYATGAALASDQMGITDGLGGIALFGLGIEGFKGANWTYKNFTKPIDPALAQNLKWYDFGGKWKNYQGKTGVVDQWNLNKAATKLKADNFWKAFKLDKTGTIKSMFADYRAKSLLEAIPKPDKLAKMPADVQALYAKAEAAAKTVGSTGVTSSRALKVANARLAQANAAAHGTLKSTGMFGKTFSSIGKYTGFSKASGALKNFATKSPMTASLLKAFKGNGLYAGILAAAAVFTDIIPTFASLGAGKGVKQVGKSAVKVGAEIGGWVVGAKAGAIAGAAIGTMIPIPVVGTVVGALCGLIGGIIGCNLAGKAAKAVVGKNELEIAKENQAKELAKEAKQNPELMNELLAMAQARIEKEGADSYDAQELLKIIQPNYQKNNIFAT